MPHMLIVGMTESGKTTFATRLSAQYQARGIKVIVLDPMLDPRWHADFLTDNKYEFLSVVQHPDTRSCAIFIDESGEMVGRYQDEMFWLATRARHYGHNSHFISQRAKQIAKTVRDQCSYLVLFCCSLDDSKELSNEFNRAEIRQAYTLGKGDYYLIPRWGDMIQNNIFVESSGQNNKKVDNGG